MSVVKLGTGGALNDMKIEEGNDSLETISSQAIHKESLLTFSRTGDSPVQWIQFLHDQPDLSCWPLLTPLKVTMHKCEKCSREFCSPVNYRRHSRIHRRSLNVNKESHKNRELFAAFWDKLSAEEAKQVLSLKDVSLKEIPSSSVIRTLSSSLHQSAVWTLPQAYVRAGSILSDIIEANPCRLPISSQELFGILDDASENTFLCAGTAESLQKYVFDEETTKQSLKLTNLIACTSFLFEQQLVKAWVADKDAEALRCQKLLVEEEEAAQKRQAELLERKKQKKLRQKEHKTKDELYGWLNLALDAIDESLSAEPSDPPSSPSHSNLDSLDMPVNVASSPETIQLRSEEIDGSEDQFDLSSEHNFQTVETQMMDKDGHWHLATNRWQVVKSKKCGQNGFYGTRNIQLLKPEPVQKLAPPKDHGSLLNGSKVRTNKFIADCDDENSKPRLHVDTSYQTDCDDENSKPRLPAEISDQTDCYDENSKPRLRVEIGYQTDCDPENSEPRLHVETSNQTEQNSCKVMIGSIPVTLKDRDDGQDTRSAKHSIPKKTGLLEKLVTDSAVQPCSSIDQHETSGNSPVGKGDIASEQSMLEKGDDQTACCQKCPQSSPTHSDDLNVGKNNDVFSDGDARRGGLLFSIAAAREFLSQRWKEAMSSNHLELVLSAGLKPPLCSSFEGNSMDAQTSDIHECAVNANAKKQPTGPIGVNLKCPG